MFFKFAILFCVFLLFVDTEAFVKRELNAPALDALKKNMEDFKNCIDKSLANVVGEVQEDHLKPIFSVLGDQVNRFTKAVSLWEPQCDHIIRPMAKIRNYCDQDYCCPASTAYCDMFDAITKPQHSPAVY